MEKEKKFAVALGLVLALAAGLRLAPLLAIGPQTEPDTGAYLQVAGILAETGNFSWVDDVTGRLEPYAYRMPLFHVFAAGLMKVFGPEISAPLAAANVLLSLLVVLTAGLCFRALAGPGTGLLAAGLAALNPNAVFNAALLLTDNYFAFFAFLMVAAGLAALRRRSGAAFFLWGLAIGLCSMVRPIMKFYWPVPLLLLLLPWFRASLREKARLGLLCAAGAALLLLPWAARNYSRLGFFGLELNQGVNTLWSTIDMVRPSTPEQAAADPLQARVRDIVAASSGPLAAETEIRSRLGLSLPQTSAAMSRLGVETVLNNPGGFLLRFLRNAANIATSPSAVLELAGRLAGGGAGSLPGLAAAAKERNWFALALNLGTRAVLAAIFFVLAPLGALLLWRRAGDGARLELLMLISVIAYTVLLTAMVAGYDRYRLPLDPLLLGFAAAWLVEKLHSPARGRPGVKIV